VEAALSSAVSGTGSAAVRISPSVIILCMVATVFGVVAGYGLFGRSPDYLSYRSIYDQLRPHDLLSNYRFERGYMLTSWFCKFYLGMDFPQFYSLLASLSLLLKFRLLWRRVSAPLLAAAIYLVGFFPLAEYTQLRSAVAFAFAFTAMDEYLNGRWLLAIVLFVVATLFHSTALALAGGAIAVLLVRNRTPIVAAGFFTLIGLGASLLVSAAMHVLQRINPLAWTYVHKALMNQPPNLLSGENILLLLLIVSSAIFLRPWQHRRDGFFYYLSFWSLIAYAALLRIPVFAHRISEAFIFSCFFFAFRFDDFHRSRVPACLMMTIGGWMLYEFIARQMIMASNG
jgi:hypothetical protein